MDDGSRGLLPAASEEAGMGFLRRDDEVKIQREQLRIRDTVAERR
jgi:hypothetical protein